MKINIDDIVLVAVPESTKKYREYGIKLPAGQKDDFQLSRGQVWELGILNHQKNHFKTIREIGSNGYYVRYMAYPGENVTVSGGKAVTGWKQTDDNIWCASVEGVEYVPGT